MNNPLYKTTSKFKLVLIIVGLILPMSAFCAPTHYSIQCNSLDSIANRAAVMNIIKAIIKASSNFDINAVADLYAPNAVVADEMAPFSWNGTTAGVQWVNVVEKTCKNYKLKEFKGEIGKIAVYIQTDESIYVVVPVDFTGQIKGEPFEEGGAFTFVFRLVSGKWVIKSQAWTGKRGL